MVVHGASPMMRSLGEFKACVGGETLAWAVFLLVGDARLIKAYDIISYFVNSYTIQ